MPRRCWPRRRRGDVTDETPVKVTPTWAKGDSLFAPGWSGIVTAGGPAGRSRPRHTLTHFPERQRKDLHFHCESVTGGAYCRAIPVSALRGGGSSGGRTACLDRI